MSSVPNSLLLPFRISPTLDIMTDSIPKTQKQWYITGRDGFNSLEFQENVPVPEFGSGQVLVKIQGASINYRDLVIPMGKYPFPLAETFVPGSDGAGTVVAVGKHVRRFKPGDKVVTLFNQGHIGGSLDSISLQTGLGGLIDGTLRQYGAFEQDGLVKMPEGLTFLEAATLTCAGLTAWNALNGLRPVKTGDWVLTQGTGGVSLFAIQFAKASGARVVSTTGSPDKVNILEKLGADHIINYKQTPEWGAKAKELTGGHGFDHIIEVAGPKSMQQSLNAVAIDGIISIIGFVGGNADGGEPGFLEVLQKMCTVRGILVGSRVLMQDMCQAVESNLDKLRPIVDPKVFSLEQVKEAYNYQWDAKHVGNVVIEIK